MVGDKFKFRGSTFRIIKVVLETIFAINEDKPFEKIRRFPTLIVTK